MLDAIIRIVDTFAEIIGAVFATWLIIHIVYREGRARGFEEGYSDAEDRYSQFAQPKRKFSDE